MSDVFSYSDATWRELEALVLTAGGKPARQKFRAMRSALERRVDGWKKRIREWDGRGKDQAPKFQRAQSAARELADALKDLTLEVPAAFFAGNDLLYPHPYRFGPTLDPVALGEGQQQFSKFIEALEHIESRAGIMNKSRRVDKLFMKKRFYVDLALIWYELGLHIRYRPDAPVNEFVVAACRGVFSFGASKNPEALVSNVLRAARGLLDPT